MMKIKGCGTALVTPFKDGKVDFESYRVLVRRQVEAGIHFLVPLGTTAETPCLTDEEKVELLRITRELCPDRPVVVGAGTNSPAQTIRNIRLLEPCGPDAFLIVVPYYNKPTQEGIYEYFKAVAASTSKAIVVYNVPGRTGVNLTSETTLRLAGIPNVTAVKEASGDLGQISRVISGRPAGIGVLSGNDDQTLPLMACGADGVISVASNVAPEQMKALTRAVAASDLKEAIRLNNSLMPLYHACFVESNPIPAKAALSLMGLCSDEMRLPLLPATGGTRTLLADVLRKLQLL